MIARSQYRSRQAPEAPFRRILTVALATATAAATTAAVLASTTATAGAAPARATLTPLPGGPVTVTLVTGDQVVLGGHGARPVMRPAHPRERFESYSGPSGDLYVVPASALPYLGRSLDPSLFDVTALARDGGADAKQIPVDLAGQPGKAAPAIPGLTLTSAAGGYFTTASAAAFGTALRQRIGADRAAGRPAGTTPVAGTAKLALRGATKLAAPALKLPLHPLEFDAFGKTGAPAGVIVRVFNTDSLNRLDPWVLADPGGIGKVMAPAGHYAAAAIFPEFDTAGVVTEEREVVVNDFTVPEATKATKVKLDARATTLVSVTTPRPAKADFLSVTLIRRDATGGVDFLQAQGPAVPVYLSPQKAAKTGTSLLAIQWGGAGTAPGAPYRYDASFTTAQGIPASQHYTVRKADLATVRHHVSVDPATPAAPGLLDIYGSSADLDPLPIFWAEVPSPVLPGVLTQYVTVTGGAGAWGFGVRLPGDGLMFMQMPRAFPRGVTTDVDWAHGPNPPGHREWTFTVPAWGRACFACMSDDGMLGVLFDSATDSQADHEDDPYPPSGSTTHFSIVRDGVTLLDQQDVFGGLAEHVPATASTYSVVYEMDKTAVAHQSQSTKSRTELTIKYDPKPDPGSALPAFEPCFTQTDKCQILPVLTLRYGLKSDLRNTSTLATQTMTVDVGHLTYGGFGSHAAIKSAFVSVSFDGGKTWKDATTTGSAGHYTARWANEGAAGTQPTLRVTATDAGGNAITQTIEKAYTFGGKK
ncbi:MAG: hypothetical protein JWO79_3898 [Actinomycetia bacterium]|nr:hypothetical protein [Actinomycetes bacterium]